MVNGIGTGEGGLARAAVESALKAALQRKAQSLQNLQGLASQISGSEGPTPAEKPFADLVTGSVRDLDATVKMAEALPAEVVKGNLDFHEVAARLKEAGLAFDFALQVRNKLIDAYREVMRMSV